MEGVSRGGVLDTPIGVADELGHVTSVFATIGVTEDTLGRLKELGGRLTHSPTKHARGEGDAGSSVGRDV